MGFLHWLSECDTPLSIHSHNLPDSATLREQNDSPDPTYQDCWPSERYLSDGPDDGDQCSECRCAPGQPHALGCDEAAKVTDSVINAAPEHVDFCASEWLREHPVWVCNDCGQDRYGSPFGIATWHVGVCDICGEEKYVTEPSGFCGYHSVATTVESCPECGSVTDLDYGPESVLLPKRESGAEEETCVDDNPLLNHMECTFNSCMDIAVAKNEGYAGSADPMANFNDSVRLGVPVPISVAIRLSDKWARLCRLLQTGENPLADESITDTIMDSINYLAILLYALSPATASQDEDAALCGKAGLVTSAHS